MSTPDVTPPACGSPVAPTCVAAVVWLGECAVGPTPCRDAVRELATTLGLAVSEHVPVEGLSLSGVTGERQLVERFMAGLALSGAEIATAPEAHCPNATSWTVFVLMRRRTPPR